MKDNKYRVTSFRDETFIDEKNIEEVIYRLNTNYEMMKGLYEDSVEEIERLHSIIKEVREYIEKNSYTTIETIDGINYFIVRLDKCVDLLDILKGVDKE